MHSVAPRSIDFILTSFQKNGNKNEKSSNNFNGQQKYQPPGRNGPGKKFVLPMPFVFIDFLDFCFTLHYGLLYSSALNARSLKQTFNLHRVVSCMNELLPDVPTSFIVSATVNKGRAAGRGVAEMADKFASMSVGGARREMHHPPPMKAGGWRGGPGESFVRRSHEVVQPARSYTRKVAG